MPSEGDRAWCCNLLIHLTKGFGELGLFVFVTFCLLQMLLFELLHS